MSTNDFTKNMAERFPMGGDKKAPPPPPAKEKAPPPPAKEKAPPPPPAAKKGPPPPPAKKELFSEQEKEDMRAGAREVGTPERGFVNPDEAPDVAARSPEHAKELQGTKAPEPPPPDDLDALEGDEKQVREQLLKIGSAIEAFPANTRIRTPNLKLAIRAKRKELEAKGEQVAAFTGTTEEGERVVETVGVDDPTTMQFSHVEKVTIHAPGEGPEVGVEPAPAESEDDGVKLDIVLLINATQVLDDYGTHDEVSQATLVLDANEVLGQDWQSFDFGKGPSELRGAVAENLVSLKYGANMVISIDTRTAAGQALVDLLSAEARAIVRGC